MRQKKVLLLNPPGDQIYIRDYYCSKVSKTNYIYEPPDLLFLSGTLYGRHKVQVLDAIAERLSFEESAKRIMQFNPDVIIFLTGSVSFSSDFEFMKRIKQACSAKLIASGDVVMENGARVMVEHPWLDAIILDFTTNDILKYLENKGTINNMIYRKRGGKIIEGRREFPRGEYFEIPLPRHELFPNHLYRYPFTLRKKFATVLTDYGCPFNCKFCIMGTLGFKFRKVANVMQELRYLKKLGFREIYFDDQTFGANRKRTEALLNAIIKEKLDFTWSCFSRVDVVDAKLLGLMKQAGCHTIMFGVESANPEILKKYFKGISRSQIMKAFELCRKLRIKTLATFMLGFPGESKESAIETIKFAKALNPDYASFNIPVPRMGTQLRKEAIESDLISPDVMEMDQTGTYIAMHTSEMKKSELAELRQQAIREFYMRPTYLLGKIVKARNLHELKENLVDGLALIRKM